MNGMTDPDAQQTLALVLTTEASRERAEALALALLERRLVACVSLLPVQSHFRWQGRLERAEEVQLLLKTSPEHLEELRAALATLHSYETPEWIHWRAITAGAYGAWCHEQLERTRDEPQGLSRTFLPPDPSDTPGAGGRGG